MSLSCSRSSSLAIMRSTIVTISSSRELVEHDDVVDAVEELGAEVLLELVVDLVLHPLVVDDLVSSESAKPRLKPLEMSRVPRLVVMMMTVFLKSTTRPWRVGEPTVLEDLQQRVEDVRVRLLDLVEEHDARTACGAPSR